MISGEPRNERGDSRAHVMRACEFIYRALLCDGAQSVSYTVDAINPGLRTRGEWAMNVPLDNYSGDLECTLEARNVP